MSKPFPAVRLLGLAVLSFMIGVIAVLVGPRPIPNHSGMSAGGFFLLASVALFLAWVPVAIWQFLWRSAGRNMEAGKRSA